MKEFADPANPPKRWVHPCNCTLVAHEHCLLDWISVSENTPRKDSSSVLKCAQCGGKYELESDSPAILRIMKSVKGFLSTTGVGVTVIASTTTVVSMGVGMLYSNF